MPKLPDNLVKPPVFDNPLRRTTPTPTAQATAASPASDQVERSDRGTVISIVPAIVPAVIAESPDDEVIEAIAMTHRITLRIDDATRCALETECYTRRVAGEKTNLAEIARGILKQWADNATSARAVVIPNPNT